MTSTPPAPQAAGLVRTLDGLGGFFALAAPPPQGSDAVPWAQVLSGPALEPRFDAVRTLLADGAGIPVGELDPKVAVSAVQVGLASRLWSVVLASAVLHSWVPDLSSASLLASPVHRGSVPLGVRDADHGYAVTSPEEAARRIGKTVVASSLHDLHEACAKTGRTPERVLVSNSTSSLVGALRVLGGRRPEVAGRVAELGRLLLADPAVRAGGALVPASDLPAGVGTEVPGHDPAEAAFLRTGCCVFYHLPEHGLCPDCVLAPTHPGRVTEAH
ncbi:(2Fe-2S)-binding protein [Ornithinimicrobium sp. W1665]|uniref:(2Fe-2S)-binding protein n=1 Tax=Ornithinimicrobium sp. W1665 TaxID=3416666 RepID=UPI003CFB49A4